MFLKNFIFISLLFGSYRVFSTSELGPGYLGDKMSPSWYITAGKWSVSTPKRSSSQWLQPTLYVTCYVNTTVATPGLSLWFSFEVHPKDSKPVFTYSFLGLLRLFLFPTSVDRPVQVSAGGDISFPGRFFRRAVSDLVNEDYNVTLKGPDRRKWLYEFAHSPKKKLYISGKGIKINATFWHQDLEKWLKETLEKCP